MQQNLYENSTFGDMKFRSEEFKYLGKNAFSDQLMAMRNRAIDDKRLLLSRKKVALETEDKLEVIVENTDEGIIEMLKILDRSSADILTGAAYIKISTYFINNIDKILVPLGVQYDPDEEGSIFKRNEDGTV